MAKSRRTQIVLSGEERERLERIKTDPHSILKHVLRATINLQLGDGLTQSQTMRATGMCRSRRSGGGGTASSRRVLTACFTTPPRRRGRKPILQEKVGELIELAMSPPPEHSSHWTLRALAKNLGIAVSTVFSILKRNGLKPHRVKTFKVSRDPRFEPRVRDVVGLYVNPPDHAVVISVDEKTQIQALGRTQTPLPMKPGHSETRTHDDKRNGTTCLMAALDVATGKVTGQMVERHCSEEFLALVSEGIKPANPGSCHSRQRLLPQVGRSQPTAEGPPGLVVPFRPDLCLLDERRRGFPFQALEAEAQARDLQFARRVHRGGRALHRASQRR